MQEIIFRPIEKWDLNLIIDERLKIPETLRTPMALNLDQQIDYYNNVLCNRESRTRYFTFRFGLNNIGYGGIENIEWENSRGEISILVFEGFRKKGYGFKIVDKIIDYGFKFLNLNVVWGECYLCGNVKFWEKYIDYKSKKNIKDKLIKDIKTLTLPDRKFFNGIYYDSLYFSFRRNQ